MEHIDLGGIAVETVIAGTGPPLLFLHGGDYVAQNRPFLDRLARRWRVVAPRHPGFGATPRPQWFRSVHDIAYLYLDLLDRLALTDTLLVGASFGGWIALEIAVRSEARLGRIVLIDSLGVKLGGREERDIADIYALPAEEVLRRSFVEPARVVPDYAKLDDSELLAIARDREATALYGWKPYMHDPALRPLAASDHPTDPGAVGQGGRHRHARLWRAACRRASQRPLRADRTGAAHYPQIEQPERVAAAIERFAPGELK